MNKMTSVLFGYYLNVKSTHFLISCSRLTIVNIDGALWVVWFYWSKVAYGFASVALSWLIYSPMTWFSCPIWINAPRLDLTTGCKWCGGCRSPWGSTEMLLIEMHIPACPPTLYSHRHSRVCNSVSERPYASGNSRILKVKSQGNVQEK